MGDLVSLEHSWPPVNLRTEEKILTDRAFTPEMAEISGFGGGYEGCCRKMVLAGLDWFDAHPDADPKFKSYNNIYGVLIDDNDDAKALSAAVVAGAGADGATGAMHQTCIYHVLHSRAVGWDVYCAQSRADASPERTE